MTIKLLFTCDAKYLKHAAICALSVRDNLARGNRIRAYLVYSGIKKSLVAWYRLLLSLNGIRLIPIELDIHHIVKDLPVHSHFTEHMYYRIFSPLVIEESRMIYLDPDIVALGDIAELWRMDLAGKTCAAVAEDPGSRHKARIGLAPNACYFNSGVLVLDMARLRMRIGEMVRWIDGNRGSIHWGDQDALNVVLSKDWLELDPKWNAKSSDPASRVGDIALLHFAGYAKPWHVGNDDMSRKHYLRALRRHFPLAFIELSLKELYREERKAIAARLKKTSGRRKPEPSALHVTNRKSAKDLTR